MDGGKADSKGKRTFLGFGFGPIQSGLFLFEAFASGNFGRFVIAEVDKSAVEAVRANGGRYALNIARRDRIDQEEIGPIEIYDPRDPDGREALVATAAEADEMATALPSVRFYDGGEASPARIVAEGLIRRAAPRPTILYAAENHNHAAEILREAIGHHAPASALTGFQCLNTVIGKMSGIISEPAVIARMGLETVTRSIPRAILVEEFNRILISRVELPGFRRGIEVFVEKDELLPFEEAKLYGHNAIHALIAYLADLKGYETIADAGRDEWIMTTARKAFIDESGEALCRRHERLGERLFTREGYREYAEDLLDRMVRPTLNDLVSRVGRDHVRKLGYDDRLYGTMRIALGYGIEPVNLALGAAAGVMSLVKRRGELAQLPAGLPESTEGITMERLREVLGAIWGERTTQESEKLVVLTWEALGALREKMS